MSPPRHPLKDILLNTSTLMHLPGSDLTAMVRLLIPEVLVAEVLVPEVEEVVRNARDLGDEDADFCDQHLPETRSQELPELCFPGGLRF